jgi:hypothetical protein
MHSQSPFRGTASIHYSLVARVYWKSDTDHGIVADKKPTGDQSMRLGEMELEAAAKAAAGNWRKFECFIWDRERDLDDAANWAIVYTHNRDSGLLDQSNAAAIEEAMQTFTDDDDPDVVFESHSHWAVGHVDGCSIRVYRDSQITGAFRTYHALAQRLADYPILDEEDYSRREHEATLENLPDAAWRLKNEYDLPEGWEADVYSWLSDNDPGAVENRDDQGGYPSEDQLRAAFEALGYQGQLV